MTAAELDEVVDGVEEVVGAAVVAVDEGGTGGEEEEELGVFVSDTGASGSVESVADDDAGEVELAGVVEVGLEEEEEVAVATVAAAAGDESEDPPRLLLKERIR